MVKTVHSIIERAASIKAAAISAVAAKSVKRPADSYAIFATNTTAIAWETLSPGLDLFLERGSHQGLQTFKHLF